MINRIVSLGFVLNLALIAPGIQGEVRAAEKKPNFIVLLADDLGYGDLACYGSKTIKTPNIDQLAKEGLRFTDFHSNGSNCSPTRTALLTGRYQHRAGMPLLASEHNYLKAEEITIAEALKSAGYATALFGKWHVGDKPESQPVKQGFDEFIGFLGGGSDYYEKTDWRKGLSPFKEKGYITTLVADHSIDFIKRKKSTPFYLQVAFNAPHTPIQDPKTGAKSKTAATYYAMVEAMDTEIGRILAAVSEEGIAENTLIFFSSDNGAPTKVEGVSNGVCRDGKGTVWEGGHRVAGIARWPGRIPAGKTTDQVAMTMDLMPTFLEFAGVPTPTGLKFDGVSLASMLTEGKPLLPRLVFFDKGSGTAGRDGPWKVVCEGNQTMLFNLQEDISEKNDLASKHPERVKALVSEINKWAEDVGSKQSAKSR